MSNAPIFCKFAHHATLQAEGDRVRIYWNADQGYACGPGHQDFHLNTNGEPIVSAVNVSEFVCHVMTVRTVFEVNGRDDGLPTIRRLADTLRAGAPKPDELRHAAQAVVKAKNDPYANFAEAMRRLERALEPSRLPA